jgi:predicted transcriptional regulator
MMIDFACQQFDLTSIIKCSLSLTKADFKVLSFMTQNTSEWLTSDDLAKKLKLNLSTIQRAVKKLHEKELVDRNQNNLDNGGYIYIYKSKPKSDIADIIMKIVNAWVSKVGDELKNW